MGDKILAECKVRFPVPTMAVCRAPVPSPCRSLTVARAQVATSRYHGSPQHTMLEYTVVTRQRQHEPHETVLGIIKRGRCWPGNSY